MCVCVCVCVCCVVLCVCMCVGVACVQCAILGYSSSEQSWTLKVGVK